MAEGGKSPSCCRRLASLAQAFAVLRIAELRDLDEEDWLISFELARDSARRELQLLVTEAAEAQDLVIPDLLDGTVYSARAAFVCGYAAAFYLAERELGEVAPPDKVEGLLLRELDYVQAPGEAGVPHLLMISTALHMLGHPAEAARTLALLAQALTSANQPGSVAGIPDPYHSVEEVLLWNLGVESDLEDDNAVGEVHTRHVLVEWFARRGGRPIIEKLWPAITHLHFMEFRPSDAANLLAHDDPEGQQHAWAPPMPASWQAIVEDASSVQEASLPSRLWQHVYMLPYLPLLYPYRLTSAVGRALDYMVLGICQVILSDDDDVAS